MLGLIFLAINKHCVNTQCSPPFPRNTSSLVLPLSSAASSSSPAQRQGTDQYFFLQMGDGGIPDAVTLSQCWSQSSFSVLLPQCWQGVSFYPYSMRKNVGGRKKKKKKGVLMKVQWKSHHQRSRLSCHSQSVPGRPRWLSCYLQISLDKQVCLYLSHLPAKLSFFNLNSNKFEFNG